MYGDTTVMRKRAGQLREQGVDITMLADQLAARVDSLDWSGRAADTMRARVRDRAAQLRDAAAAHETAADSLGRHLAEVELLKEAIDGAEHRAGSRINDTDTDPVPASFIAPPPGHRDWLSVTLPGL